MGDPVTEPVGKTEGQAPAKPEIGGLSDVWTGEFFQNLGKPKAEQKPAAAKAEDDCPECEKERRAREAAEKAKKPPYKVLKVQGQEHPVESEDELLRLAQMGLDYTKKTQSVAEERRAVEAQKSELQRLMDEVNQMRGKTPPPPGGPENGKPPVEKSVFEQYEVDEEMLDPWQKRLLTDKAQSDRELRETRERQGRLEEALQFMYVEKAGTVIAEATAKAREEFPVEDIVDERGESLTKKQFLTGLAERMRDKANANRPLPEIARETVREIHLTQKATREAGAKGAQAEVPSADMSFEQFREKYPDLATKYREAAISEYLAENSKLPPTIKSDGKAVDTGSQSEKKREFGSLDEALDAGYEDMMRKHQR